MTDGHADTAAYNERCQTRASVITRWVLLVPGCALPLLAALWESLTRAEVVGVAAGIAAWTAIMIRFHVWRLVYGHYGETTRLTVSAALYMVLQWLLGAFAPKEVLFAFYSPAVIASSYLQIPHLEVEDPVIACLLTLACGAQALVCVLGLWRGLERLQ
jgi:hypothetical protein